MHGTKNKGKYLQCTLRVVDHQLEDLSSSSFWLSRVYVPSSGLNFLIYISKLLELNQMPRRSFLALSIYFSCTNTYRHFLCITHDTPTNGTSLCNGSCCWHAFKQWHPTPVLLPGRSHGWRSLVGCSPWGREESDTTERLHFHFSLSCIGEGNGNPLQCSCLENPRDGGTWWAAVYGVAQSRTRLKRLSSILILAHTQIWVSIPRLFILPSQTYAFSSYFSIKYPLQ